MLPDSIPPEHPNLDGHVPPGLYGFEDESGDPIEGGEGVIPILEMIDSRLYRFIGTGFFVTSFGIFATAKHVLLSAHENGHPIFTWQLIPPNQWFIRPVLQFSFHDTADVAIGLAAPAAHVATGEPLLSPRVRLTTRLQSPSDIVATFAYPSSVVEKRGDGQVLSFQPEFYEGRIVEYLPGVRDSIMLPGPCYRTSMVIHHGASGGPVAGPSGRVFGINSTGFDGTEDFYISRIDEILLLEICLNEEGQNRVTLQHFVDQGSVTVDK